MRAAEFTESRAGLPRSIDMLETGMIEVAKFLEERPELVESQSGWDHIKNALSKLTGEQPQLGQTYSVLNLIIVPLGQFLLQQIQKQPMKLAKINQLDNYVQYEFEYNNQIFKFPEDYRAGDRLSKTYLYTNPTELDKVLTVLSLSLPGWEIRSRIVENFADGKVKGKSRPGRVKRAGASCKGSVTDLRKRAKNASGEKAKMYHWCANMKSGKKR